MSVLTHYLKWSIGMAVAETQTSAAERACLMRHASHKQRLVEIGVWHGVTTCCLRRVMSEEGVLFAVDPFPRGRLGLSFQKRIADKEVSRVQNGKVEWVREKGVDAARIYQQRYQEGIDFLFIDGDHSYNGLKADWESWKQLVKPKGIVALHDSRPTPQRPIHDAGSVKFTEEVIMREPSYKLEESVDTLSIFKRTT